MMKSRENAKKPVFLAFSAGKICISKFGFGHILDIAILHQCAEFHVDSKNAINKPHADWTYLIMKVQTSVRRNERTNEGTKERRNERKSDITNVFV